ncbi:MAG: NAD(P)/FAD-dependent oxidoreductase [Methanomassiliicoccales archaeon]
MYDVLVSGAGPAGSYASYLLANSGYKVGLIEREQLPRTKCCAGGVMQRALGLLDFQLPEDVIERRVTGVNVVLGDRMHAIDSGKVVISTVRRSKFDAFLSAKAEKAGCEIFEGQKLEDVREIDDSVEVTIGMKTMQARSLVIAEGSTSVNASRLYGPYPGKYSSMGMAVECNESFDRGDRVELFLIDSPTKNIRWGPGFPLMGWMFPLRTGCNIGVIGSGYSGDDLKKAMATVSGNLERRTGILPDIEGATAHPIPLRARKVLHTRRTLLVGDAGGLTSAISGEGMSYAFQSARYASLALKGLLSGSGKDPLAAYDCLCHDNIVRDMKAAELISPVLHWLIGVVDAHKFFDNVVGYPGIVRASEGIAVGAEDWRRLLAETIPSFPRLFFSSL